jgi:hypothetical protein
VHSFDDENFVDWYIKQRFKRLLAVNRSLEAEWVRACA